MVNNFGLRIPLDNYKSGSDNDAQSATDSVHSDNSFTDYGTFIRESKDPDTRRMWASMYLYFKENSPGRNCGYGNFPFHLAAYLFWRDQSGLAGKFNPTTHNKYTLHSNTLLQGDIQNFACHLIKMDPNDYSDFIAKGDANKFKRAMKPRSLNGEKIPIDKEYMRLKKALKIESF